MIHLVFCLRRASHLSRESFQRYWSETHAPLVRRHASALGIRRYVQAHTIAHSIAAAARSARGAPPEYDGVAELWFDEDELARRGASTETVEAARALLEDEARFIDLAQSPIFLTRENVVIG
ncbi:MAG TPA: EthD domain-containing protein [Candidatus Binatia bacterium]|nr:EthD domain-containing protein [Candidatus Binatia bacterium]